MIKRIIKGAVLSLVMMGTANAALLNASDYFNELIGNSASTQLTTNTWQLGFVNAAGNFELFGYSATDIVTGVYKQGNPYASYANGLYSGFGVNLNSVTPSNELFAHPSLANDLVLRYRAETTGLFQFDTTVRYANGNGSVALTVEQGTQTLASRAQIANVPGPTPGSTTYNEQLLLTSGDTVDFILDIDGNMTFDGLFINANAGYANAGPSQVSAPGSLALLGLALLGLGAMRRKAQ
jgi:hypothetical protein